MKKTNFIHIALSTVIFFFITVITVAQNIGINATGATPNTSAGLDVDFNNKGLLIPRITTVQRNAITSPALGLLIWNIDCENMNAYTSSGWQTVTIGGGGAPTGVTASANPNPLCAGSTLTLTGGATGATSWSWTGPNGFTSTSQNPTIANITIAGAGVYSLTASNSCGSATPVSTASVIVNTFSAIGGTITYSDASGLNPRSSPPYPGGYTIHTFTSSGTFDVSCGSKNVEVLVVAGGGGGGSNYGGGGGAGGMLTDNAYFASGNITVTIGIGGVGGTNANAGIPGGNSVFGTLTAIGGGFGGGNNVGQQNGGGGGSGGGGAIISSGGAGTGGQGNNGGIGCDCGSTSEIGGGGGGAGAVGSDGLIAGKPGNGGNGGISAISGSSITYAGGGGGAAGTGYVSEGTGGTGGGGNGGGSGSGNAGTVNTGGGGGAGGWNGTTQNPGGAGGSGIVIVRYIP